MKNSDSQKQKHQKDIDFIKRNPVIDILIDRAKLLVCQQALEKIEKIANDYNKAEKTSQYCRDGFEQILDTIRKIEDSKQ